MYRGICIYIDEFVYLRGGIIVIILLMLLFFFNEVNLRDQMLIFYLTSSSPAHFLSSGQVFPTNSPSHAPSCPL